MVGARTAVLVVPPTIYLLSNFHRVAPAVVAADLMKAFSITAASLGALAAIYPYVFAVIALVAGSLAETIFLAFGIMQWRTGAILDAAWTRLVSGGVRSYPEAAIARHSAYVWGWRPARSCPRSS
jgi:hypothetical protein